MDFNQFDSVAAAEKGAELHVKHPVTGQPLFANPKDPTKNNGKPCIVVLMGNEAASVRAANRKLQKEIAAEKPEGSDDEEQISLDDLHDRMVRGLVPRVSEFRNISKGKQPATRDDAEWFFNLNRMNTVEGEVSFAEQAAEFTSKRANYLGNGSGG